MASRHRLDDATRWRIVGRLEAGQSQATCCRDLGVPRNVVSTLWKQFTETGTVVRRPGQGRKMASTAAEDRYLRLLAKRDRSATATQLSRNLYNATGTSISRITVTQRLHAGGLYARRPVVCIPLTVNHKKARLAFCREHLSWTEAGWGRVLFSDESRFSLDSDSRRVLIWREPGSRYQPSNIVEKDHYGGGGLMVWAGIMADGRTDLHVFDRGTLTGQRYRDEILAPYVRLFRGAYGPNFLFMDDNARPHRAQLVDDYLESENIQRLEWPAMSPDLNPIEHVWDALGRSIGARRPAPTTIDELKGALLQEWARLPQGLMRTLVNSMKRRCESCVAVRGDHTPY